MTKLTFLGAARTVTGSKYLLDVGGARDPHRLRAVSGSQRAAASQLGAAARSIRRILSAVVLTHAHLDHTGYLPRLVAEGYRGRCSARRARPTCASSCCPIRRGFRKKMRAKRTGCTTRSTTPRCRSIESRTRSARCRSFSRWASTRRVAGRWRRHRVHQRRPPAGIVVHQDDDQGQGRPFCLAAIWAAMGGRCLPDPSPPPPADVLLLESTYGDRVHEPDDRGARLAAIIKDTVARGGKVIIPAFAIGRVEEVLYWIKKLEDEGRFRSCRCFSTARWRSTRCAITPAARASSIRTSRSAVEIRRSSPRVSSRCVGSAVVRARALENPVDRRFVERHGDRRTRSPSSAGRAARQAQHGAVRRLSGGGHPRPAARRRRARSEDPRAVRAGQRAHREASIRCRRTPIQQETLRWLGGFTAPPRMTYLVHGEPGPMDALKATIQSRLHWNVHTPDHLEQVELS